MKSEGVCEWLIECVPNCPLTPTTGLQDKHHFFLFWRNCNLPWLQPEKLWRLDHWNFDGFDLAAETLMTGHQQETFFISSQYKFINPYQSVESNTTLEAGTGLTSSNQRLLEACILQQGGASWTHCGADKTVAGGWQAGEHVPHLPSEKKMDFSFPRN